MAKWFSLLAFVIAAGAAFLLFQSQGNVETMQKKGESLKSDLNTTQNSLKTTKESLVTVTTDRDAQKAEKEKNAMDLATANTNLSAANKQLEDIQAQIKEAFPNTDIKSGLAGLKENIQKLTDAQKAAEDKIAAATKDKDDAVAKAAELDKKVNEQKLVIDNMTSEKKIADEKATVQGKQIDRYVKGFMEKNIRGRVLAVNSGWGFAVVSIGDKQGAAANKTLIVARGGQAIGKLRISNIENNQSIADIIPNSFVGGSYVQPGDDVIYTGEDKAKADDTTAAPGTPVPPLPVH